MTLDELKSYQQFEGLDHYDGNDMDLIIPKNPHGEVINSAMTVEEADKFLNDPRNIPAYVEFHTADNGDVGYEVVFWYK